MKVLRINARRWFSSQGNTYFSCSIEVDNTQVHYIPYEYGYDQHYEWVAKEWLQENDYLPKDLKVALSIYCRENDIILISHATDVNRKKDL